MARRSLGTLPVLRGPDARERARRTPRVAAARRLRAKTIRWLPSSRQLLEKPVRYFSRQLSITCMVLTNNIQKGLFFLPLVLPPAPSLKCWKVRKNW